MNYTHVLKATGAAAMVASVMIPFASASATPANPVCYTAAYKDGSISQAVVTFTGSNDATCKNVNKTVSLNSYTAQGPSFNTSGTQTFIDHQSVTVSASNPTATLSVKVQAADCFYQTDLYEGSQRFDGVDGQVPHYPDVYTPGNLVAHRNGGTTVCMPGKGGGTPTPMPTHTPTPVPSATPAPTVTPQAMPQTLPDTGSSLGGLIGLGSMLTAGTAYLRSRRAR